MVRITRRRRRGARRSTKRSAKRSTSRRSTGGRGVPLRPNNNTPLMVYPNNGAANNGASNNGYYNEANSVRTHTFFDAIYAGETAYVRDEVLNHGFDVATMDPRDERTPVIAAVVAGNAELVKLFLTEDADPDMTLTHADTYGKTAANYLAEATYNAATKAAIRAELNSA
jgi:hypothetical protein